PGVLQRIAVVYLVSALIFLKAPVRNLPWIGGGLLVFYWILMNFVPVPGIGPANLGKETNLAAWMDRAVLTEAHLWKSARTWDPGGILSTIPAVATALMGAITGLVVRQEKVDSATKLTWLYTAGLLSLIAGMVWGLQLPINKSLWTSSFVLYTGGWAILLFSMCYWLIDIQGFRKFTTPFVVFGVNAITVFFLSGLIPR